MHILIVSSVPYQIRSVPLGGIFQRHQAKVLVESGHLIGIASGGVLPLRDVWMARPPTAEQADTGLVVRNFEKSLLPLRFWKEDWLHRRQVQALVDSITEYIDAGGVPDCIHAHNVQYAGLAAFEIFKKTRLPYLITEHSSSFLTGAAPEALRPAFVSARKHASLNFAVSSVLAHRLDQLLPAGQETTVLPNVLDPDFASSPHPLSVKRPYTILSVGRLDKNKNHALLISAFSRRFRGLGAALRIGGAGSELGNLKQLTKDLDMEDQVTFLGLLSRDAVAREMSGADCFALPSVHETFGVVAIEALACGTPVVSTPCGGTFDIINDANGVISRSHSVEDFEEALFRVFGQRAQYAHHLIRQTTLEKYGGQAFARTMGSVYAKMAERAR